MLILLWGLPEESPLAAVYRNLQQWGMPTVLLDQREVLDTTIKLSVGSEIQGLIQTRDQIIDLSAVTAFYLRPHDARQISHLASSEPQSTAGQHILAVTDTLLSWAEITPAMVINRPAAMVSNSSKPYQLEKIRAIGFHVPDTLVTTDAKAALAFWDYHGSVIYKSVSVIRSKVSRLTRDHQARLAHVSWCPTQFQQYVPGTDYRVHVVGQEVFATRILSGADDYRYPQAEIDYPQIESCKIPAEVEERCCNLTQALGLKFAGIDLRQSPTEEWYCFEVNPSPGFSYYQQFTGQPISQAVAALLCQH